MGMPETEVVKVQMFEDLVLRYRQNLVSSHDFHSDKIAKLLVYFLMNHTRIIEGSELCDFLWQKGESNNPIGALKNLVYRLRVTLKDTLKRDDFIITKRGAYGWNPDILCELDFEIFEASFHEAKAAKDRDEKKEYLERCVNLYRGPFLPKLSGDHVILTSATYFQSLYHSIIKDLSAIYDEEHLYDTIEKLCNRALKFETLDEKIHYYLIKSYLCQGKKKLAMHHYKQTVDLLYSQLGIQPDNELKNLYQEMLKDQKEQELDLQKIQSNIQAEGSPNGAYYCEYGVFQNIYSLQARQAKRLGISVYCGLITVKPMLNIPKGSKMYLNIIDRAMKNLQHILSISLRGGDVISRFSMTQFIVLLPTCNYDTGIMVMNRINENFHIYDPTCKVKLLCEVKELELS